jgi:F-type H+-transporting ATPase subunit epsilon
MKTRVVTLKGVKYEGEAKSVNVKTTDGEVTVLNNHRPFVTVLAPCVARIETDSNEEKFVDITGGFLYMDTANQLTILADEK